MSDSVGTARPTAAKDVSMAGIVGTLGMLAEASGCGAVLDVARVPRPAAATTGDWLTCFPGFGMLTTGSRSAACGTRGSDADCGGAGAGRRRARCAGRTATETEAITAGVTGMGRA